MPFKRVVFNPGLNREVTSYAGENGYYDGDKVRFRYGLPEKIGGWISLSNYLGVTGSFLGTARSMWNWANVAGYNLLGIGTNLKYYVENGGVYYDITPLRATATLTNPFTTVSGSATLEISHTAHGATTGDYVTFSGATAVGGIPAASINSPQTFYITVINANSYSIVVNTPATSSGSGGGTVVAKYDVPTGPNYTYSSGGWGRGNWGDTGWGISSDVYTGVTSTLRIWDAHNYGQNLLFGIRSGDIYYWDASNLPANFANRGVRLTDYVQSVNPSELNAPIKQAELLVSDTTRFVLVFGANPIGSMTADPLLIRWSDQERLDVWTPAITNQAGSIRLSSGTKIIGAISTKQEVNVWTDSALYSMQYIGPPYVWGLTLAAENISIASPQCMTTVNNVTYWMGRDKFYIYSGKADTLPCSVRKYVFGDIDRLQFDKVICGTNEGFSEVWWFYCSANAAEIDRYVVYNHLDKVWTYGNMSRTAWLDSGIRDYPMAVESNQVLYHEYGADDQSGASPAAISAYIQSSDFDLDDGDNFSFVNRIIPDLTFSGSTSASPSVTFVLKPRSESGVDYTAETPQSIQRSASYPVEQYTKMLYVRARGRQMAFRVESTTVGTAWQLGAPRIDIRPDGKKV
jgi:hypothetical protein